MCVASVTSCGANLGSALKSDTVGHHEQRQEREAYPAWLGVLALDGTCSALALNGTCSTCSVAGAGTVSEIVARAMPAAAAC